jgi:hypothetical protein
MSETSDRQASYDVHSDEGVRVGDADVQADMDRASGDKGDEPGSEEFLQQGSVEMSADQGEAVGPADVDEDRGNAAGAE